MCIKLVPNSGVCPSCLSCSMSFSIRPSLLQSLPSSPHKFYTPRFNPSVSTTSRNSLKLNFLNCSTSSEMASLSGKGKRVVKVYDTEEQLALSLADYTFNLSNKFVDYKDAFTVVVSGGSLIKSLRKLVDPPYADVIPWSKWHVFWVDERVVPKDHADSNYKLCYDGFLSKVGIPGEQVYAIKEGVSAEAAAEDYERRIREAAEEGRVKACDKTGFPKFDLMLLGIGPDGHVASLFPGHPLVEERNRWVVSIVDSPKPPPERITFTFPVINSAANIAMVATGEGKSGAVRVGVGKGGGDDGGGGQVLPLQLVSPLEELVWFLDKPAASKL